MTGVEGVASDPGGPSAPDPEYVAVVKLGEIVLATPQDEKRADDLAASAAVVVIGRAIDTEAGAVVLAHRMSDGWVGNDSGDVGMVLLPHDAGIKPVPSADVVGDQTLGQRRGLTHEEPVPPCGGEPGVTAGQGLADWHVTENHDPVDAIGMIEGQGLHDVAATIVANNVEAMMAERFLSATRSPAIARLLACE